MAAEEALLKRVLPQNMEAEQAEHIGAQGPGQGAEQAYIRV